VDHKLGIDLRMKMQPSLERALSRDESLKA